MVTGKLTLAKNKGVDCSMRYVMPSLKEDLSARIVTPRLRVIITCVTFETVKVVKPIRDLRGERVYILHYNREGPKDKVSVYSEFYDEVVNQLHEMGFRDEDIVERNVPVFRFKDVLSELVGIMTKERAVGNEVYINVSAGSMEFAAAATVSAMMVDGVKPFTVHARKYTISGYEDVKRTFSIDGKLIGQCREVAEPVELPTFPIEPPPRDLVVALRELRRIKDMKRPTKYSTMIQAIKDAGAWTYDPEKEARFKAVDPHRGEKVMQAEKMYYSRHYIDGWIRYGWVDGKAGRGRDLVITDAGVNVSDVFYLDHLKGA